MSGILRLESLTKGNTLRQGDLTLLKYRLFDADGDKLDISGKPATVRLMKNDFTFIAYEKEGLTVAPDDTISFNINKILPGGLYHLEIIVDDKYVFPSRADEGKFNVDKSSLGAEITIIENAGIDAVVRKAVDLINADPSLIIDEDKLVGDIISNTGIGNINEYYQAFNDLKPKAEQSISRSLEALTKSRNALNVANGIDAKATNALSLSESAYTLSKSVQDQFNQVVIDGDSSVEAAQARVDASGHTNPTLKARLDKEHNEVTTNLTKSAITKSKNSPTTKRIIPRRPIISFIDDDGHKKAHSILRDMFNSRNMVCNFAIITGWIDSNPTVTMTRDQIRDLVADGHELMGHTHEAHSPNMEMKNYEELMLDMEENRKRLELLGSKSRGFVYPQNRHNAYIRRAVQSHFDFSFGGTGINRATVNPMEINRIGVGRWGSGPDLELYKSHVDDVLVNGGWLVFMLHIGTDSSEEIAVLEQLLDYIQTKDIDVVSATEGYEMYGPNLLIGDEKEKYLKIGGNSITGNYDLLLDGVFRTSHLPVNAHGATAPISDFRIGESVIQISSTFARSDGQFPVDVAGALHTYRYTTSEHAYNRQEYRVFDSDDIWVRHVLTNGSWGNWVRIATSDEIDKYTMNLSTGDELPNDYPVRKRTVEYAAASRMANLNYPVKGAAMIITDVSISHDMVHQQVIDRNGGEIYFRSGSGVTWRAWRKFQTVNA